MSRKSKPNEPAIEPQEGVGTGGESINPSGLPEHSEPEEKEPRAAPGPGVPISIEEYNRLKEAAKRAPAAPVSNAQEDKGPKKKKRK